MTTTEADGCPDSGERGDVDLVHEVTRAMEITLAEHGLAFDPVDDAERVGRALTANLIARIPRLRADRPSSTEVRVGRLRLCPDCSGLRAGRCETCNESGLVTARPDPSTSGEDACHVCSEYPDGQDRECGACGRMIADPAPTESEPHRDLPDRGLAESAEISATNVQGPWPTAAACLRECARRLRGRGEGGSE